jgi:hypothetical protein
MTVHYINPEEYAAHWTNKVLAQLEAQGLSGSELEELRLVLLSFVRIAAELIQKEPVLTLPDTSGLDNMNHPMVKDLSQLFNQQAPLEMDIPKCDQLVDLFIRSIILMSKSLRQTPFDWDTRRSILEQASWETFNLSKLFVALYNLPNSKLKYLDDQKVIQKELLKQGTQSIVDRHVQNLDAPQTKQGAN